MVYIIVRHGNYDPRSGRLNKTGHNQMNMLVEKLLYRSAITAGGSVVVLSSTAERAIDSAQAIGKALNSCEVICELIEPLEVLLSKGGFIEPNHPQKAYQEITSRLSDKKFDAVVVVSHFELSPYLVEEFGAVGWIPDPGVIEKGDAVIVYEDGSCKYIRL